MEDGSKINDQVEGDASIGNALQEFKGQDKSRSLPVEGGLGIVLIGCGSLQAEGGRKTVSTDRYRAVRI